MSSRTTNTNNNLAPVPVSTPAKMRTAPFTPRRPLSTHGSVSSLSSVSSAASTGSYSSGTSFSSAASSASGASTTPSTGRPNSVYYTASNGRSTPSSNGRATPSNASIRSTTSVAGSIRSTSSASSYHTTHSKSNSTSTPLLASTHKKYKAPISVESRKQPKVSSLNLGLPSVPGSPSGRKTPTRPRSDTLFVNNPTPGSRPRTPVTPRKGEAATSEMDVTNVDPEQVLVDSETVDHEEGDVSVDIGGADHGSQDKVMVSIRVRPTQGKSAWIPSAEDNTIRLDPNHNASSAPFTFDAILTGTPNKPIYTTVARSHVHAAMEGFNAVIFAYGQTASGKTFTLSGTQDEPGIIPRAMREVFAFIRNTPGREYLLRCSYLEIYNESIGDLLAPPGSAAVQLQGGSGEDVILTPLREEVVTSLKGVREVLKRGEGNRRTACTDWNERSSRSHSVFRMVIESRERGGEQGDDDDDDEVPVLPTLSNGRHTPGLGGRQTPGLNGRQTPAGPRLQARGGRSVQTSVLSLIDLAGSEKATSDKERTREGKYINTSLLTLGTVIATLAANASKPPHAKPDHVPYRNSKLTRMLQPSLGGNARISVICTVNPDASAIAESTSTLLFAKRVKSVKLNAQKKEVVDTDALLERYRKEIADLKARLADREADAPVRNRRLSAREQIDESKAMKDLNNRIQQLTKLILTSASDGVAGEGGVGEGEGEGEGGLGVDSRPVSPAKVDFDKGIYQLQQELLAAKHQLESQATQILSLEAALASIPSPLDTSLSSSGSSASEEQAKEKDTMITEQAKTIHELEEVVRGYEENLDRGEPLRKEKEREREREWEARLAEEVSKREEKERWAEEVVKGLEREKKMRQTLEEERRALAAFVSKFDSLGLSITSASTPSGIPCSKVNPPLPTPGGARTAFAQRRQSQGRCFSGASTATIMEESPRSLLSSSTSSSTSSIHTLTPYDADSPMRFPVHHLASFPSSGEPSLLGEVPLQLLDGDVSFEFDEMEVERALLDVSMHPAGGKGMKEREVLDEMDKENILPASLLAA